MDFRKILYCIMSNGCEGVLKQNMVLKRENVNIKKEIETLKKSSEKTLEEVKELKAEKARLLQAIKDYEKEQEEVYKENQEFMKLYFKDIWETVDKEAEKKIRQVFGVPVLVTYAGRPKPTDPSVNFTMDVRLFITPDDALMRKELVKNKMTLKDYVDRIGSIGEAMDQLVVDVWKWRLPMVKYQYDDKIPYPVKKVEFWKLPQETIADGYGDCEDTTNEILSWMRNAGIPSYRLHNVCGFTSSGGGHSTLYYLDSGGVFRHLETTLDFTRAKTIRDVPDRDHKDAGWIVSPWFAFNDSMAYHKFTLAGFVKRKSRWGKIKIKKMR